MKLDLKKFKKIGQSKSHSTFEHPEGHVIHVAHSTLDRNTKSQLRQLPKLTYAEGGMVKAEKKPIEQPQQVPPLDAEETKKFIKGFQASTGFADGGEVPMTEEPMLQPEQAPAAEPSIENFLLQDPNAGRDPSSDPFGAQASQEHLQRGYEQQLTGINQEAQAQSDLGSANAGIEQQQVGNLQTMQDHYNNEYQALNGEREAFLSDLNQMHVDPNHYVNNMSTGQKILTTIGLILGGYGSGGDGSRNAGLQVLQKNIENDIMAQRANIGKQESLLSANLKQYGNLHDATTMTKVMMNDITAAKLRQEAAVAQSPLAQARALQMAGQLETQNAPVLAQAAARRALLKGAGTGQVNPAHIIAAAVPEGRKKEITKELQDAQNRAASAKNAVQVFDELNNSAFSGSLTPGKKKAMIDPIAVAMARDAAGRVNEYEMKAFQGLFPAFGDTSSTRDTKREQLMKTLKEKMHFPGLEEFGIPAPSISSAAPNTNVPKGYKK